jgi:hypothetical protein
MLEFTGCFKIIGHFSHTKIFEHLLRNFFLTKETSTFRASLRDLAEFEGIRCAARMRFARKSEEISLQQPFLLNE